MRLDKGVAHVLTTSLISIIHDWVPASHPSGSLNPITTPPFGIPWEMDDGPYIIETNSPGGGFEPRTAEGEGGSGDQFQCHDSVCPETEKALESEVSSRPGQAIPAFCSHIGVQDLLVRPKR
jgi:hypothetical protein